MKKEPLICVKYRKISQETIQFSINDLNLTFKLDEFEPIRKFLNLKEYLTDFLSIDKVIHVIDYLIDSKNYIQAIQLINYDYLHEYLKNKYDLKFKCGKCQSITDYLKQPIVIEYTRYYCPFFTNVGFTYMDDYEPKEIKEKYICINCENELSLEEIWYVIKRDNELIETDVNALTLKFEVWKNDKAPIVVEQWDGYRC